MTSTNDSKASRYNVLVWNHEMKLALVASNEHVLNHVVEKALSMIGFPVQQDGAALLYTLKNVTSEKDGFRKKSIGTLTVQLPKGELTLYVSASVPYEGATTDKYPHVSFGDETTIVTGVDSYEAIADAAYKAMRQAIH